MSTNVKFVVRSKMTMICENKGGENGAGFKGDAMHDPQVTFQAQLSRAVAQEGNEGDSLVTVHLPSFYCAADGVVKGRTDPEGVGCSLNNCTFTGMGPMHCPQDELRWAARKWSQYLAAIFASLLCFAIGFVNGWSAFAVPYFTTPDNSIVTTGGNPELKNVSLAGTIVLGDVILGTTPLQGTGNDQATRLCSMVSVGGILGTISAGALANVLGRKKVLLLMTGPIVAIWAMILFSGDVVSGIYTSRVITGFAMGVVSVVVSLYIGEISEVHSRGALVVYHQMLQTAGILVAYVAGFSLPVSLNTVLPCIVPIAVLILVSAIPESPFYLLSKGRLEETKRALRFFRGPWLSLEQAAGDVTSHVSRVAQAAEASSEMRSAPLKTRAVAAAKRFFGNRGAHAAFGLMIYRQLAGANAMAFYAVDIFSGSDNTISGQQSAILIGSVEVCAIFLASMAVDRVGRRPLMLLSSLGMAIAHGGMTFYFTMISDGHDMSSWWWVPVLMISIFTVMYSLGFGPIPWLLMVELIPPEDRVWATGVAGALNYGSMYVTIQMFSMVSATIGSQYAFLFFSVFCVMGHVYVHNCVPETKGKTLDEIQRMMKKETGDFFHRLQ